MVSYILSAKKRFALQTSNLKLEQNRHFKSYDCFMF